MSVAAFGLLWALVHGIFRVGGGEKKSVRSCTFAGGMMGSRGCHREVMANHPPPPALLYVRGEQSMIYSMGPEMVYTPCPPVVSNMVTTASVVSVQRIGNVVIPVPFIDLLPDPPEQLVMPLHTEALRDVRIYAIPQPLLEGWPLDELQRINVEAVVRVVCELTTATDVLLETSTVLTRVFPLVAPSTVRLFCHPSLSDMIHLADVCALVWWMMPFMVDGHVVTKMDMLAQRLVNIGVTSVFSAHIPDTLMETESTIVSIAAHRPGVVTVTEPHNRRSHVVPVFLWDAMRTTPVELLFIPASVYPRAFLTQRCVSTEDLSRLLPPGLTPLTTLGSGGSHHMFRAHSIAPMRWSPLAILPPVVRECPVRPYWGEGCDDIINMEWEGDDMPDWLMAPRVGCGVLGGAVLTVSRPLARVNRGGDISLLIQTPPLTMVTPLTLVLKGDGFIDNVVATMTQRSCVLKTRWSGPEPPRFITVTALTPDGAVSDTGCFELPPADFTGDLMRREPVPLTTIAVASRGELDWWIEALTDMFGHHRLDDGRFWFPDMALAVVPTPDGAAATRADVILTETTTRSGEGVETPVVCVGPTPQRCAGTVLWLLRECVRASPRRACPPPPTILTGVTTLATALDCLVAAMKPPHLPTPERGMDLVVMLQHALREVGVEFSTIRDELREECALTPSASHAAVCTRLLTTLAPSHLFMSRGMYSEALCGYTKSWVAGMLLLTHLNTTNHPGLKTCGQGLLQCMTCMARAAYGHGSPSLAWSLLWLGIQLVTSPSPQTRTGVDADDPVLFPLLLGLARTMIWVDPARTDVAIDLARLVLRLAEDIEPSSTHTVADALETVATLVLVRGRRIHHLREAEAKMSLALEIRMALTRGTEECRSRTVVTLIHRIDTLILMADFLKIRGYEASWRHYTTMIGQLLTTARDMIPDETQSRHESVRGLASAYAAVLRLGGLEKHGLRDWWGPWPKNRCVVSTAQQDKIVKMIMTRRRDDGIAALYPVDSCTAIMVLVGTSVEGPVLIVLYGQRTLAARDIDVRNVLGAAARYVAPLKVVTDDPGPIFVVVPNTTTRNLVSIGLACTTLADLEHILGVLRDLAEAMGEFHAAGIILGTLEPSLIYHHPDKGVHFIALGRAAAQASYVKIREDVRAFGKLIRRLCASSNEALLATQRVWDACLSTDSSVGMAKVVTLIEGCLATMRSRPEGAARAPGGRGEAPRPFGPLVSPTPTGGRARARGSVSGADAKGAGSRPTGARRQRSGSPPPDAPVGRPLADCRIAALTTGDGRRDVRQRSVERASKNDSGAGTSSSEPDHHDA
jgi:hypothetical protein